MMTEIVSTADVLGGAPRLAGRRIGVHHIAQRIIDAGIAPEQVAADYDISLGDVHRALTYYYDHPDEMQSLAAEHRESLKELNVIRGPGELDIRDGPEPET